MLWKNIETLSRISDEIYQDFDFNDVIIEDDNGWIYDNETMSRILAYGYFEDEPDADNFKVSLNIIIRDDEIEASAFYMESGNLINEKVYPLSDFEPSTRSIR